MAAAPDPRMSRPGLTEQQHRAVTARGVSVALSAGAGCGKTTVLTERFLAELEPGNGQPQPHLGQVVAITFTERAAREMRGRIRKACRQRLLDCPPQQVDYWQNLVRELDAARISTIHAFCGSLLRSHAVEAGLDPRFRVLDGSQSGTLLYELIDDELRSRLADRDAGALALAVRYNFEQLRSMIARLVAARDQINWPQWQEETPESLVARWEEFWRSETVPLVLRRFSESPAGKTVLDLALRYPPAHPKMRERCDRLLEQLPSLPQSDHPLEQLAVIGEAARVQGGGTAKHWVSEAVYERFRDAAKRLRDDIKDVTQRMTFDPLAARPAAETGLQLLALAAAVDAKYHEKKRALGVLDFSDLMIHARGLLVGPQRRGLRRQLAAQIHLLLVDEFQDTDPLQVELVKALCDNEYLHGKLFFVGDYKQSIYRFRGADPQVFRQLRAEIPAEGRLPLVENFRSQPAVLHVVNALFCDCLGPDYEPLQPHRPQVGPTPAVEFLWASESVERETESGRGSEAAPPGGENGETPGAAERRRRCEADWIARRIRVMLDARQRIVWDQAAAAAGAPATRAVRPGDIALLFRALTHVECYEEALRGYGIDYYLVGGHAFYAQQEIFDLLNLLRTLETPNDQVSLAGVLRSPMFGLYDETLLWLSLDRGGLAGGLFAGELPEQLDGQQRRQTEFAAQTLRELRAMKDRLPMLVLIHEALHRTGYDALLLTEFLGERKLANLHKLIEQARSFDSAGIFTLSDFITQLAEFVARQPDEPLAATHPESDDLVKLMTIHQAKGLEFPVTIVPNVGWSRRTQSSAIAFTPRLGPMVKEKGATCGYDLHLLAADEEEAAEFRRLLYVAATRAADYLILAAGREELNLDGGETRATKAARPWADLLGQRFDLLKGTLKVELPVGLAVPEVRVTTRQPAVGSKPVDLRQRRDLMKILDQARQMAAERMGKTPGYLAPLSADPTGRRQFSFSRLSGQLSQPVVPVEADSFEAEAFAPPRLDPRGLGTLVHAVLAELDFAGSAGESERLSEHVADLVRRHAPMHLPDSTEQELEAPIDMLRRFLASPRAAEIAAAQQVYRELEFLLPWPPEDSPAGGRYLQGFIDCLYGDVAGQWRLVDYKTNRVARENVAAAAAAYEMQMLVYALAAERILKRPPAELVLCFLAPGVEYRFPWDDAARGQVVELVDGAMPRAINART